MTICICHQCDSGNGGEDLCSYFSCKHRFQGGLSSTPHFFLQECKNLKDIFLKLKYPEKLIDSTVSSFQHPPDISHVSHTPSYSPLRITIPFKDQKSVDVVHRQLGDLGRKINHDLQPIFTSKKIIDYLRYTELKPTVNQQSVVYELHVICVTQIVSVTRAATSISVKRNINIL